MTERSKMLPFELPSSPRPTIYEIEMAAGGLKGSFYESMPDSMKPKAKGKRPLNDSTND